MHPRKIAAGNAVLFFFFWLLILLAGADFPPPIGFLWVILAIAGCAVVVYWRIPTYIDWYLTQRPGRRAHVILDGLIAGFVIAVVFILNRKGEPSVPNRRLADYALWFAILGLMGVLNAATLYLISMFFLRKLEHD
ncbi:MAG: hypothetical protein ACK2T4_10830 [Candidatus Promineifilaceae bacterium]|jgi:hypothetical protein